MASFGHVIEGGRASTWPNGDNYRSGYVLGGDRPGAAEPPETQRTPRAPARACLPLLPLGPGGFTGWRRTRGRARSYAVPSAVSAVLAGPGTLARGGFA